MLAQTVALVAAAIAALAAAWQARRAHVAVTRVELSVNGRLNQLVTATSTAARAEGFVAGIASTAIAQGVESTRDKPAEPKPDPAT